MLIKAWVSRQIKTRKTEKKGPKRISDILKFRSGTPRFRQVVVEENCVTGSQMVVRDGIVPRRSGLAVN